MTLFETPLAYLTQELERLMEYDILLARKTISLEKFHD